MNPWIPTSKMLPEIDELVEIKLPDGYIFRAKIITNQHDESIWETEAKKTAHLRDYSVAERVRFQIVTNTDFQPPIAWRRINIQRLERLR